MGAGWSLVAGGVISRAVRGAPDEKFTSNCDYGHFSDYGFSNYITRSDPGALNNVVVDHRDFALGKKDGEPDLFSFNFNGYSGKFYFRDDRMPVVVDGEDLKIEYHYTGSSGGLSANIQGFVITTPDGNKYHFGVTPGGSIGGADAIETTFPLSTRNYLTTEIVISSWYLTKISSADGMFSINLTYQAENYSYYTLATYPVDPYPQPPLDGGNPDPLWFIFQYPFEYDLTKMIISGVRLNQITFSNGSVIFNAASTARTDLGGVDTWVLETDHANTQAKALESIEVNNTTGFCKKFRFFYSYFADNTSALTGHLDNSYPNVQTDRYRLKLDSLKEQSCDNSIINSPYKFIYYSNFLPRRLSFAQDHWGYYNGVVNETLIPTYSVNTYEFVNGANRDSKWPEMLNGALTQIRYPTGGFTAMEFEPHTTWVNTTQSTPFPRYYYSVGYDGNANAQFSNVAFTNNRYQVTINNAACPSGQSSGSCVATAYLVNSSSQTIPLVTATGAQSNTYVFQVPAGNYTVHLTRSNTQTGAGAQVNFTEIVSTPYQTNAMVGGLRIKKMTKNDGVSFQNNIVTSYDYNVNNQSTGVLYSRPSYVQIVRNDVVKQFGLAGASNYNPTHVEVNGCLNPAISSKAYYKSPCSVLPMSTTQGNHIGYNEVKISQSGNGYSIYRYYGSNLWENIFDDVAYRNVNASDNCSLNIPNYPVAPVPYEYRRGELKYEAHVNEAGQTLKDIYYYYQYDSTSATPAFLVKYTLGTILPSNYELRGYWKKQTQTVTFDRVPGGETNTSTNTTYFESAFHRQPTKQETITSLGETQAVKTKYALDFRISPCDTISDCSAPYTSSCSSCDATLAAANLNCTTISCKYWAWMVNEICRANARTTYVTCRRTKFTNPTNTFDSCMANAKINADALLKPILELRNEFNNAPVETSTWKNTNLTGANFNQFGFMTNPAGKAYLLKTRQINLAATSATFANAITSANNLSITSDSRYEDENNVQFNAGNVATVTPKSGLPVAYLWSYANTVPVAKVQNALTTQIAYTSFENGASDGNWTLPDATMNTSFQITGAKSYSLITGKTISATPTSGVQYYVSYWSRNGAITVKANTVTIALSFTGPTKNGWTYYEHLLPNTTTAIALTATSAVIDELRLYPKGAHMSTYTYSPVVGMTSSCDDINRLSYYEYDPLGRLVRMKDQDGNIIKTYNYHYKSQQAGN